MSKCVRCGSSFTFRKKIQLKDAEICKRCFRELGFDEDHDHFSEAYSYDEIKNGREEMIKQRQIENVMPRVYVQYGGKEKELDTEDEEEQIFDILSSLFEQLGRNPEELDFVRLSDNYVTAKLGEWDLARFHWGKRAKWIKFTVIEPTNERHVIQSPEDVKQFADLVEKTVNHIEKYS